MGLDPERAKRLKQAENAVCRAQEQYEAARATRNRLVREALADRYTMQDVADATGLSRQRISQIAATKD